MLNDQKSSPESSFVISFLLSKRRSDLETAERSTDLLSTHEQTFSFQRHHVSVRFCFFQGNPAAVVQLQGDGDPAGHGGGRLGRPPGRRADLRYLPQDQVRRRLREPVFVLPDQVLCPLWGASLPEIQHGKKRGCGGRPTQYFLLNKVILYLSHNIFTSYSSKHHGRDHSHRFILISRNRPIMSRLSDSAFICLTCFYSK